VSTSEGMKRAEIDSSIKRRRQALFELAKMREGVRVEAVVKCHHLDRALSAI